MASGLVLPVAAVPVELPVSEAELDFAKLPPSRLAAKAAPAVAPVEEIEENTDRDNFMSAEEACEFNLIDKVVTNISEAEASTS